MSEPQKANLIQSMALGGTSAVFAVNFTHRKFQFILCIFLHHYAFLFFERRILPRANIDNKC
jgi:hypothetical protein